MSKKIFSGVQPTGNLHLGNYIGAIKNFVSLQNDPENFCIYCVVDLHAITLKQNAKDLKKNSFKVFSYLSIGVLLATPQKLMEELSFFDLIFIPYDFR